MAKHYAKGVLTGQELSVTKDPGKYIGNHRKGVEKFGLPLDEDDFEELHAAFHEIERADRERAN